MTDVITLTGLYLTLVGLLASFFWLNLGSWVRDLTSLDAEARYLERQTGSQASQAKLKIQHRLAGLKNATYFVTTLVVFSFAVFLLVSSLGLLADVEGDAAASLGAALRVFLVLYVLLTALLVGRGAWLIREVGKRVK